MGGVGTSGRSQYTWAGRAQLGGVGTHGRSRYTWAGGYTWARAAHLGRGRAHLAHCFMAQFQSFYVVTYLIRSNETQDKLGQRERLNFAVINTVVTVLVTIMCP